MKSELIDRQESAKKVEKDSRFSVASVQKSRTRSFIWWTAVVGLILGAGALRLWGVENGLPFIYNPDENTHFVTRAIGMFDHGLNPHYFLNPPGFTYVLYLVFTVVFGGEGVQKTFALDPGQVFLVGRLTTVFLGAASVGLLVWAGVRIFDRRVGLLAGAILATAFLPVFYSHFALNDAITLAPICITLAAAGLLLNRRSSSSAFDGEKTPSIFACILGGAGVGLATDTKYIAAIVVWVMFVAILFSTNSWRTRFVGFAVTGFSTVVFFVLANPYAVLETGSFLHDVKVQAKAVEGGQVGLPNENGILYYLKTITWGLGWIPLLAAALGAVTLAKRSWRIAVALIPVPIAFLIFMGLEDRYFARWGLPIYPMLALLAAYAAIYWSTWISVRISKSQRGNEKTSSRAFGQGSVGLALVLGVFVIALVGQGFYTSVHNDQVLSRTDTRELTRNWMLKNIPAGSRIVLEPIVPNLWGITDCGQKGQEKPYRWVRWSTSLNDRGLSAKKSVEYEQYQASLSKGLIDNYTKRGFCWVVTGSIQSGRSLLEPAKAGNAIGYYDELRRQGKVAFRASPYEAGVKHLPFSFDHSFIYYPDSFFRPGPEVTIYKLAGDRCRN